MKYKISVVSYLNTIPFIFGLKQSGLDKKLDISLDIPSVCADKLLKGKVDIGLVPIVVMKQLENTQVISDFCISSKKEYRHLNHCQVLETSHSYFEVHLQLTLRNYFPQALLGMNYILVLIFL